MEETQTNKTKEPELTTETPETQTEPVTQTPEPQPTETPTETQTEPTETPEAEPLDAPSLESLEQELEYEKHRHSRGHVLRNIIYVFIIAAAAAVLIATQVLPVLRVYGNSMTPALHQNEVYAAVKTTGYKRGDIVAFYYNNRVIVKRIVALSGEWVDIDDDGNVTIDGQALDEPYLTEKDLGRTDITYPFQVPDGRYFVLGDNRKDSIDSRMSVIGCISDDQIVGRLFVCVWPFKEFHLVQNPF